jgi:hypothetical protein
VLQSADAVGAPRAAQAYQADALLAAALSEPPERAQTLRHRAYLELMPQAMAVLERRRLAGTLLPGKCALHEVEYARQVYVAAGVENNTPVAQFVGYQAYLKAAHVQLHSTRYPAVLSQFTTAQTQQIISCGAIALDMMSALRTKKGELADFNYEALLLHIATGVVQNHADFHVSGMHRNAMAAALGRLEASGVIEERGLRVILLDTVLGRDQREAKVQADVETRGLLACAHCGAREVHVAQFKRCSACKVPRFCSKDCQLAHWPSHKAACKAARKAAAGAAAGA